MPSLHFRLKKRSDATAQLTLVRDDGTITSGAVGPADGYFPAHDISHYVFEQTLGLSEGFLGLVASGWDIKDFEVKGVSKWLTPETMLAECAAGELSRQILMRQPSTFEEFVWVLETVVLSKAPQYAAPVLTEEMLTRMREQIMTELQRWRELPLDSTFELVFTCPRVATVAPPTPAERKVGSRIAT